MEDKFLEKFIKKYNIPETDKYIISELYPYDPSSNKKYLHWMYKIFKEEFEDLKYFRDDVWSDIMVGLNKLENYSDRFKNANLSTDIYSYESSENFLMSVEKAYQKQLKKVQLKNDIDLVDEFNGIVILYPSTSEASCFYGKGTRWCVTSDEDTYNDYMEKGNLFFILNKESNDNDYKTALYVDFFNRVEGYDAEDSKINVKFEDVNEILYLKQGGKIIYPKRVSSSIGKYINNIKTEKPGQLFAKVFNSWVKSLGGNYKPNVDNFETASFYLEERQGLIYEVIGDYRIFNDSTLKEFISDEENLDYGDIFYSSSKLRSLIKVIGEKRLVKYFNWDDIFEEMLKDDNKFRFYDEYNIEDIEGYDYFHTIKLTPELEELKKEFEKDPIEFYDKNIYVGVRANQPRYGTYKGLEGIMFYYDNYMDTKKLINDYPLILIDAKSDPIIWMYEGKKYYIINEKDDNKELNGN